MSVAVLSLSACSLLPGTGQASPRPSASHVTLEPDSTESPAAPAPVELYPEGSAADNLPYFAQQIISVWNGADALNSRAYFDALVNAGFEASVISRTSDTTAIGLAADTFSVAVAWHDGQCLVGQVGTSTGNPVAQLAPQLSGGRCLIGAVLVGE